LDVEVLGGDQTEVSYQPPGQLVRVIIAEVANPLVLAR